MKKPTSVTSNHKSLIYLFYTLIFLVICGLTYSLPWLSGKSLIWNIDGIAQHFPILAQFQGILQGTVHQSLAGWSWNLGAGGDQLTTFAYYVVGDPFSYLIALFPASKLELGFQLLVLLRLFCVGLAFLTWANRFSFSNHSKLIGTLVYTFSGYNFYVSMHHPFFLLPMIIFPLLATGIEIMLKQRNWIPFAISIGLALISNFYFAYILSIGALIYLITRSIQLKAESNRQRFDWLIIYRTGQAFISGLLLSGVVLVPTLVSVFQSSRSMHEGQFANGLLLYPLSYYLSIPNQLITTTTVKSFWLVVNVSGIVFLAIIYILVHFKTYKYLATVLSAIGIGMLLPQVSAIFNALSTPSNRWLLLAVLPLSLATMIFIDQIAELTNHDLLWLICSTVGLIIIVWITRGFTLKLPANDLLNYGCLLLLLLILVTAKATSLTPTKLVTATTGIILISLINGGQGWLSPNNSVNTTGEVATGAATKWLHNYYDGAEKSVKTDNSFYRTTTARNYYPHPTAGNNIPGFLGTHDLNSYYSIQNGHLYQFNQALGNAQSVANGPVGQGDNRTTLLNLLGVKYLFAKTDILNHPQSLPYGFSLMKNHQGKPLEFHNRVVHGLSNDSGTVILKSNFALPLAYLQEQTISKTSYDRLDPIQKEQSLLQGVQVNRPVTGIKNIKPSITIKNVKYSTKLYTQHIINSASKTVRYRLKHSPNANERQMATKKMTRANLIQAAKANNVHPRSKRLQSIIQQNNRIIDLNQYHNQSGLHLMTSDAQGRQLSYQLKIDQPQQFKNCELYLVINGVNITPDTIHDQLNKLTNRATISGQPVSRLQKLDQFRNAIRYPDLGAYTLSAQTKSSFNFYRQLPTSNLSDYSKRQNIVLNLGYSAKSRGGVVIRFTEVNALHLKKVKLVAVPFNTNKYQQHITKLQQQGLQQLSVKNDRITGLTNNSNQKAILTTSIPYSSGWQLKIDGKKTPTHLVNQGFIGATIPKGRHQIIINYVTPGLKIGQLLSIVGIIWLVGFTIIRFIYKPKNEIQS
ncbi:YfhO family protein [Lentilactobacillus kosonis]|uniref:Uncharacterized protein n=1 Tax=Lentilactobacillus kosonis TaxID=2810561 RepID=A0A401FMS2_9LACO|nr:YfhO family protein [Lentilactobacillus kosonis]GAY73531.1 hypothetical protein NBRC111893_1677 [Lentilactobacillus kosonis]